MGGKGQRVCPVEMAGSLDNALRRWLQNPQKILKPFIKEGMTVLDLGCGPGFFSIDMARMVGRSGRVIASDLQEGMLRKVKAKIERTELEERIALHKCEAHRIGLFEKVDFILLFYMVHEISDKEEFFREIRSILKPNGRVLMVEPPFHVSKSAFRRTVQIAETIGLAGIDGPKVLFSKTAILRKASQEPIPRHQRGLQNV